MNEWRADDICPRPEKPVKSPTQPLSPPLFATSVWRCHSPNEADQLLGGECRGYVYQRDGHPNGDMLAEKCRELHRADHAVVTASGMAALALALVSQLSPGKRILVSGLVYGKTLQLMEREALRWGLRVELFDPTDPASCDSAFARPAHLVVVETMSNPRLRVADIAGLAGRAHAGGAKLLVDNTFATPCLCRPLETGADLVMESVTKMMNGHSDVTLGVLCGRGDLWDDVPRLLSTWGLTSSPWDCWLALRGLASLHLRMERACDNALRIAGFLSAHPRIKLVDYPGLPHHPDYELARRQLDGKFGSIVTFELWGGRDEASRLIEAAADAIPFCPSLGEISTTLSHPESTSHRSLSGAQRAAVGVTGGMIRLSCGVESGDSVEQALAAALAAV